MRPQGLVRARDQAGQLSFDVEETNLPEIEQLGVETEPLVHVAALHIVRQMVKVIKIDTLRALASVAEPIEFLGVGRTLGAIAIDKIKQRSANSFYRRSRQSLVSAVIGFGPSFTACSKACLASTTRHAIDAAQGPCSRTNRLAKEPGSALRT